MEIFKSGVDLLQLGVTAMGGGAVLMGMLNIFESLSSDNPGPRAQGMRQAFGGGVIVLIGTTLVPMLKTMLGKKQQLPAFRRAGSRSASGKEKSL